MAKTDPLLSSQITTLSKKELEKILLKAASRDQNFHDYLLLTYFDKEYGEQELFEKAKADLRKLSIKNYKGFSPQLRDANMLAAQSKRITDFSKICKNRQLEADLIMEVLEYPFSTGPDVFGTCFTAFDYRVALLVKKLVTLVTSKMHEDFKIQYQAKINKYLSILHHHCTHFGFVNALPQSI